MAGVCGFPSVSALVDATVPSGIRRRDGMPLSPGGAEGETESEFLARMRRVADQNVLARNFLGQGYYGTLTPSVILRNVLENPGWYTQYTPYQAEIAQGRLEALLVFQTAVSDLTGLPLAGASLLDEATAAAEAMAMCSAMSRGKKRRFLIADSCHPQTVAVCETRARGLGLEVEVSDPASWDLSSAEASRSVCGVLVQYPATDGRVSDHSELCRRAHAAGAKVVAATDLLALTQLVPPGEWGADVAVGS
ncbi:glycine cleavage system P-protein, partial [Helicosporidium sp. ATCC 50920]